MFKKLRIKFIAITMVMVALVMALAFSVVCIVEYQRSLNVVQTALGDAANQAINDAQNFKRFGDGQFDNGQFGRRAFNGAAPENLPSESSTSDPSTSNPQNDSAASPQSEPTVFEHGANRAYDSPQAQGVDGSSSSSAEGAAQDATESQDASAQTLTENAESFVPPEIGNRRNQPRSANSLIPVAVYRTSDADGTMVIPQVTTASISDDVLEEALGELQSAPNGFGTVADLDLHYQKAEHEGVTYIAFADTSYTDSWKTLALMLAVVGLATLVVFFVVSLFYSRWALRPVREAWDSQRQFVADASHDLKTPLTVVLANSAILLKHPEHSIASESQWIESTQKEAETMQGLVNEMLELAQIEAGEKIEVEKSQLEFSDLVEGETLMFDAVALERNCTFECEIEPDVIVIGNDKQIEKLVSTLVENAFKYVDSGGSVNISLSKPGKNAVLAIRNTGSVISPEDLPHIFDRFYRTDKARTSGEGGFGLGLAIAREIARQHGGDIACTSSEVVGTTFTVTLPAA